MNDKAVRRRADSDVADQTLSHNLQGQRLGRKGRDTRERILAATEKLLAESAAPLSLSAVAREASLGMTSLYVYFSDLTELILAVLEPIMETAEEAYMAQLRTHWPDEALGQNCLRFVTSFHAFWQRHARILHLRNAYGASEPRIVYHRVKTAQPVIELVAFQMGEESAVVGSYRRGMASALVTGIERVVTVATDAELAYVFGGAAPTTVPNQLRGQARLMELCILDGRGLADRRLGRKEG